MGKVCFVHWGISPCNLIPPDFSLLERLVYCACLTEMGKVALTGCNLMPLARAAVRSDAFGVFRGGVANMEPCISSLEERVVLELTGQNIMDCVRLLLSLVLFELEALNGLPVVHVDIGHNVGLKHIVEIQPGGQIVKIKVSWSLQAQLFILLNILLYCVCLL